MNAKLDGVCKSLCLAFLSLFIAASGFPQASPCVVVRVNNSPRVTLTGNVHPFARQGFDRGAVDSSMPMTRILMLLQRSSDQETALQTLMEQQQDKSSPNYHVWLTAQKFGAQYGPADADIQAVTQWLQSQGFTINKVYSGKTIIEFSGNAGQVQTAFGANIHSYQVNNETYVANASDPQIPIALAPVVAGLVSLNNSPASRISASLAQPAKSPANPACNRCLLFPRLQAELSTELARPIS
jgi:subtilase family serine protease